MKASFLLKRKFRNSSLYQLVEWKEMNPMEREIVAGLNDEDEVYGIFRPPFDSSNLTLKVAYRETAFLYLHLQKSQDLPHYFTVSTDKELNDDIARLILDHILEIECNGNFLGGPAALNEIFGDMLFVNEGIPDHLTKLSMDAIQYSLMLFNLDARTISNRLYTFNTTPWDTYLKSKFITSKTSKEFIFSAIDHSLYHLLEEQWNYTNSSEKNGWMCWNRRSSNHEFSTQNSFIFKLYISPLVEDLPEVFKISIPILLSSTASGFKVGNSLSGLLRPDKMVVYFENKDELKKVASELEKATQNYLAHGVPFTGQLDKCGFISWGVDPPQTDVLESIEGGSWRYRVTDQIALAISQAQSDHLNQREAIQFIGAKLSLNSINAQDWTPMDDFFSC